MKRAVYFGIDIGGTNMEVAAVGANGRVLARQTIGTRAAKGPDAAFARIASRAPGLMDPRWTLA